MADRHNIIYGLLKTKKEVYKLTKERISEEIEIVK